MEEFKNPPKEYRGTPFWAWNTKLEPDMLESQIEQFAEMGMGGFYIHTRVGLDTEYLGDEFMAAVQSCAKIAKEKDLFCCLYDEDRWPSGYGGGYVTKNHEFRSKYLLITPFRQGSKQYEPGEPDSQAASAPHGEGQFLAAYQVQLNPDGTLGDYIRCAENEDQKNGYKQWYVYLESARDNPWFNNQAYVDTLNPAAIRSFLDSTYEVYEKAVGTEFGGVIPSIFTDEPQFPHKKNLGYAFSEEEVLLPFTNDFTDTYQEQYREDICDHIPELLWELPEGKPSVSRYRYHDHVTKRFAEAFGDQVGKWCDDHGLKLGGHMMEEPTLLSQTQALGEVMRCLRGFSLPGVDMLCDAREYTTVKQAQSICRQYGKDGVISELYGVTNWDFDFRSHKLQGDWQAALGVTHRVHHLTWMSMGGEAKRDYPASIGRQSPWYQKYSLIEDHFARINTIMQRGTPIVRVAVIHPIESYWLCYGPNQQTNARRSEMDQRFADITSWLLFGTIDFDYIAESLLPELWDGGQVGEMNYNTIIVPGCITLRRTTLQILMKMKESGKKIIFMGADPRYVDAQETEEIIQFANTCEQIPYSKHTLLEALADERLVEIRYHGPKHLKKPNHKKNWNGEMAEKYFYQLRSEGDHRWLFIANGAVPGNQDLVLEDRLVFRVLGIWKLEQYDTLSGEVQPLPCQYEAEHTIFYYTMYEQDSLLLKLIPCQNTEIEVVIQNNEYQYEEINLAFSDVTIVREEPNVLLLDMPKYAIDEEAWQDREEILRIDNKVRKRKGYPLRMAALAQPWTIRAAEAETCQVRLRYDIICETDIAGLWLALEEAGQTQIYVDGKLLEQKPEGFYVDTSILKIRFPDLLKGRHELELELAFSRKTNLEACYLLGDFEVLVKGTRCCLTAKKEARSFTTLTDQGMPFYGGNAFYQTAIELEQGFYEICVSKFRAPLVEVRLDGNSIGHIFRSPYRLSFMIPESGIHHLELISYGSRINTFGTVHDCDEKEVFFDPNAWRTTKEGWSYEYQLKKTGILKAPVLYRRIEEGKER